VCSKGLCCQESIDALNWDPWSTLDWYSIDIWLTPPLILLLDQHLGRQSVKSQLIFAHMPIWVLIDVYESVNTWPTINRLSIKCRSGVDRDVHRVLTKYQSRCPSSVDQDVDQVLNQGWARVSVDTGLWMPLVHKIPITNSFIPPHIFIHPFFIFHLSLFTTKLN